MNANVKNLSVLGFAALVAACSDLPTRSAARQATSPRPALLAAGSDAVIDGTLDGSVYRLFRPANWNGRLLLYAHGTVRPNNPIALPAEGQAVILLAALESTATAFSSFRENGWAVKDGGQRTEQLRGIFVSQFGVPTHTYIAGGSQGGLIATMLAEQHPALYTGALALCAPNAGATANSAYVGNARTLFDYFYPGVLPGNTASLPPDVDVDQDIVAPAVAAMTADPSGAAAIAHVDQTPVPGVTPDEVVAAVGTALFYHGLLLDNLLDHTHDHAIFDNAATVYSGTLPPERLAAINGGVARYAGSPSGENYVQHYYDPTGQLRIPLLSIYNTRDPDVPLFNHIAYRARVAAAGASTFLVERPVEGFGHCNFGPFDVIAAFQDLVRWAELGVRPALTAR